MLYKNRTFVRQGLAVAANAAFLHLVPDTADFTDTLRSSPSSPSSALEIRPGPDGGPSGGTAGSSRLIGVRGSSRGGGQS